ncbi:MAG: purine-nucleoside phosphorylase [Ruminococcus sp.]|nr:purine-nucleoside phosphorylase [Ruminococcus sp.]
MENINLLERINGCVEAIRKKTDFVPQIALVLGSGLGGFARIIEKHTEISYSEIEGFPVSTVSGHEGKYIFGTLNGVKLVCMQGRVHCYEGYSSSDVVLPIRVMGMLGAKVLFLTNASGGISENLKAGDFMLITDHISSLIKSPLIGPNEESLGTRFPDMSEVYNKRLSEIIRRSASEVGVSLKEGVYIQTTGPNYETPAEIRAYKTLGADAVGMSTACEAIAARHMGMLVCAVSCISNLAAGISKNPLTHKEVKDTADRVAPLFERLVTQSVVNISKSMEEETK